MKYNSVLVVIVLALFITFGYEMKMGAAKTCDEILHGGYCEVLSCHLGCQAHYGDKAIGFCFFEVCTCRYPC
ncbi:hypothetical protein M5689_010201 [Euphorbia peplus]|nr:hypothetical protein M5689_010201 [Euphorbia peplus]